MTRRPFARVAPAAAVGLGALVALSACGSDGAAESDGDGDGVAVDEIVIATAETPWLASYEEMADLYEEETGVRVTMRTFPFDGLLTQQANAAQNGSNAFDVFQLNEQWVGQFYDNQWVQPLPEVDPDFAWDPNLIEFDGVGRWDAENRTTSVDGVPYALPINGNIHEFMYRADLYDELGLEVPTTWDEVIANGEAGLAGGVEHGYVLRGKTPTYDFSAVLFSHGGRWFAGEQDGDWTPQADTPEFRAALEQFKALAEIGPDAPQTVAQAEATSLMQGGSVLQATLVSAVAAPLEDEGASTVAGQIGYAVLPGQTPVSGTWTVGIPTGLPEERTQAAYDFITWLTSQETMQAWADAGGITTRTDVDSDRPELQVIIDSADMIRGGLRYTFTPLMLEVTDPTIGEYLAGTVSLDEAVTRIQDGLTRVVEEAGFGS
ncbi:ABC transporter substrate-binding protein [Quadrisphaera sp. GCM10027208]|uniref:ABC transporter substrate-binding protein n=1 Tax=Quadrisphaera sp. GCM10027208 TaxID=3273423 RepID=UPI00361D1C1D